MIGISRKPRSSKGAALITVTIVMMMVAILCLSYVTLTSTNLIRANREERSATALYLAEAGLDYIIADIMHDAETNGGIIQPWDSDTSPELNGVLDELRSGATGHVIVTPDPGGNGKLATITSSATYREITEKVRVRLKIKNISAWNNAIFAGIGASGKGINGKVDIRGSVHILGDGEPYSDSNNNLQRDTAEAYTDSNHNGQYDWGEPYTDSDHDGGYSPAEPFQDNDLDGVYDAPLTATDVVADIGGNANIGNNYSGIPDDLLAKIPTLVRQSFGGEMVDTLNAELRVKHGNVYLSGSATAGQSNHPGDTIKETLDGCFVTDGYAGKGASSVHSDNGTSQKYDLGDRVSFPGLLDAYTDPATGTYYSSFQNYLIANSALVAVPKIDSTVASFSAGSGNNTISWNQATSTLTISGIVRISGNLDLSIKDSTVYYSGKGTLFAQSGTVYVRGSVLPATMFPSTDALGVIAGKDIEFATGSGESQLSGCGAWYAEQTIRVAKQSQFAGTYVANYFDMGTNVPSIYQVPELTSHMPPGMPGGENVAVAQILSWRHLGQSE